MVFKQPYSHSAHWSTPLKAPNDYGILWETGDIVQYTERRAADDRHLLSGLSEPYFSLSLLASLSGTTSSSINVSSAKTWAAAVGFFPAGGTLFGVSIPVDVRRPFLLSPVVLADLKTVLSCQRAASALGHYMKTYDPACSQEHSLCLSPCQHPWRL